MSLYKQSSLFLRAQADWCIPASVWVGLYWKAEKWNLQGSICRGICSPSLSVLTNPIVAESCLFCFWVQAEGRNIFQNRPWDGWAPWDRIRGRTKASCGQFVKGVWMGAAVGRRLHLPFARLNGNPPLTAACAPSCPPRLSLPAGPWCQAPILLL